MENEHTKKKHAQFVRLDNSRVATAGDTEGVTVCMYIYRRFSVSLCELGSNTRALGLIDGQR